MDKLLAAMQIVEAGADLVQHLLALVRDAPSAEAASAVVLRFRAISQKVLDEDRARAQDTLRERFP